MIGILLTTVHVIACLLLIIVILLQAGRGQGLASASFGSGNVQSLFGTRAGDFLTKATTVAAVLFLLTCISLDILESQKSRSLLRASQGASPIDIEQIKKALENVKAENVPSSPASPEDSKISDVKSMAEKAAEAAGNKLVEPAAVAVKEAIADTAASIPAAPAVPQAPAAPSVPVAPVAAEQPAAN